MTADPTPAANTLRRVMSHFESGVTIVTAVREGVAHAMTATAVSAVSLTPALVLVCVGRQSRFHAIIVEQERWAISILAAGQTPVARHFADRGRDLLTQFDPIPHRLGTASGAPVIDGSVAWAECRTWARYDGGDHTIVVGELLEGGGPGEAAGQTGPLTYYRGTYSPSA